MKPKRQSVIKHVLGVERCYAKIILVLLPIFTLVAVSHAQEVKATTSEELGPNNVWSFKEDGLWEDIDKKCGGGGGFSAWRSSSKMLGIDENRVPISFIQCIASQMQKAGASPQAIAFTKEMNGGVYMGQFREMGKVDLAKTVAPTINDPNVEDFILVNGTPRIVYLWENVDKIDLTRDPLYPSLRRQYPNITMWPMHNFMEMQNLAQGGQRFLFDFMLLNGCRGCDIAGFAEIAFDFDVGGQFLGTKLVCLKEPSASGACGPGTLPEASQYTAPNANISKKLYILGLDCRQLWEYYLYYRISIPTFQAAGDLISLAEKRALQVYEFIDGINLIVGPVLSIATKGGEMKIANAVWDSSGLLLNLAPLGNADNVQFAKDLINWMRDSLAASANYLVTGKASRPDAAMVGLANRFGTLWNIQFKVLNERNAIRLADEYLTLYYRNGSDKAKVAAVYGLPSSATTEDVMKRIANQQGMGRLDYDLGKASQWVSSFKVAISNVANVCLQGSTCTVSQVSPTSTIPGQKQIRETLNKQSNKSKTNKTTPAAKPKAKADSRASCNKSSNVLSLSIGGAQGALKKFGTGTDGCAQ